MIDRREFLKVAGLTADWPHIAALAPPSGIIVNDLHSQLNATRVHHIVEPETLDAVRNALRAARREHRAVCIAGGRHAMGAQAFATAGIPVELHIHVCERQSRLRRAPELETSIQLAATVGQVAAQPGLVELEFARVIVDPPRLRGAVVGFSQRNQPACYLRVCRAALTSLAQPLL